MAVSRSCVEKMGLRWKKYKLLLRVRLKKKKKNRTNNCFKLYHVYRYILSYVRWKKKKTKVKSETEIFRLPLYFGHTIRIIIYPIIYLFIYAVTYIRHPNRKYRIRRDGHPDDPRTCGTWKKKNKNRVLQQ